MASFQPTGIQVHLITGHKCMFYQENPDLVTKICNDMDGQLFSRASLIIESKDDVTAFPGRAIMGITILTDPMPDRFFEKERATKTVITEISRETFLFTRVMNMSKIEGEPSTILSEIEFVNGERLYLEFSGITIGGMGERNILTHLFTQPSVSCRRLGGGFSIWNTNHFVSWSHNPKLQVPSNAWLAESLAEAVPTNLKMVSEGVAVVSG